MNASLLCALSLLPALSAGAAGAPANGERDYLFLPVPQKMRYVEGCLPLQDERFIWLNVPTDDAAVRIGLQLKRAMRVAGADWAITAAAGKQEALLGLSVSVDPAAVPRREGYRLKIGPDRIRIIAHDAAGAYYAAQTLEQIAAQAAGAGRLRCLEIDDWPDFPDRGVMLDVSRGKVPTMESLFALLDQLASWKVNQFQLYTEHTFAYREHRVVWENASPMTAEQILVLDRYCRERFIELVPNQTSLAHLHRWFEHKAYWPLAEQLDVRNPAGSFKGWSLCPTDPASLDFLRGLYDELLPNFTSKRFNIGFDETFGLGDGRSKPVADVRGRGQVYLDFLLQVQREAARHDREIQFWADVILDMHPPNGPSYSVTAEAIAGLPKENMTALVWGYSANHPFDQQCAKVAQAGFRFYVCPGTSTWVSIAGRLENAQGNLWNAAAAGHKHGASGYLNTNWGDDGHWETLPFSLPLFAYGAGVSWAGEPNRELNLAAVLDGVVLHDPAGIAGKLIIDLGLYRVLDGSSPEELRRSVLRTVLRNYQADWSRHPLLKQLTVENLTTTRKALRKIMGRLPGSRMQCADAEIIKAEIANAGDLLLWATRFAIAKLSAPGQKIENIPAPERADIAQELTRQLVEFRRVWLLRSRPGGLDESIKPLEKLAQSLGGA